VKTLTKRSEFRQETAARDLGNKFEYSFTPNNRNSSRVHRTRWGTRGTIALGVLIVGVLMAAFDVFGIYHLFPIGSEEGVAAGWWWCLSFSWLVAALERPTADDLAARIGLFGGGALAWLADTEVNEQEPSLAKIPAMRWYLLAAFSLFSILETTQQGAPAALGFLVGAGAFAVLFALAEMGVLLIQTGGKLRPALMARGLI
jgi:hypothetical protein